jgi:outer membrane protease
MRNIAVLLVLVSIVPAFGLYAQAPGYPETPREFSFAIAPQTGLLYGQAEEIVYPSTTKAPYLSQLLWDLKPLFYYGALFNFSYQKTMSPWGFFSDLSFKAGIPGMTGTMEDRDWQSVENDELTNFSSHDNQTAEFLWFDASAGIFVPLRHQSQLRLSIAVSYMHFAFSGFDGYATYARGKNDSGEYYSIDDSPYEYTFSGSVIHYSQDWLIIAPAISLNARFLNYFSGGLSFQISPLIICADEDEHVLTDTTFRDYTRWGLFLEPRGRLTFSPVPRFELSLDMAYRFITGSRGESYQAPTGTGEFLPSGEAGTGLSFMDSALALKVRF